MGALEEAPQSTNRSVRLQVLSARGLRLRSARQYPPWTRQKQAHRLKLLRSRLEHALVARSRNLHRVLRAVWLHGQFDVVRRAGFFEIGDELVGGVVFAVGPQVLMKLIAGLNGGGGLQCRDGS